MFLKKLLSVELNFLLVEEIKILVSANCMIPNISCSHTLNLSSCMNVAINKSELMSQYVKLTHL